MAAAVYLTWLSMWLWGHLSLGSPWTWFCIWFPSPFNRSLYVGQKCSAAGCILQENKSQWFCAPGIRQKAWNDNLSMLQSDHLDTFKITFSISLSEGIFSIVWTKTFKQWPWKSSSFLYIYLPAIRSVSLLTLSQTRTTKSECDGLLCLLCSKAIFGGIISSDLLLGKH